MLIRCIPLLDHGAVSGAVVLAPRRLRAAPPRPAAAVEGRHDPRDPPPGEEQPADDLVAAAAAGPPARVARGEGGDRGVGAPDPLDRARARDAVARGRRRRRLRRDRAAARPHGRGGPVVARPAGAASRSTATPARCRRTVATPLAVVLTELLQNAVDHAYPRRHRPRAAGSGGRRARQRRRRARRHGASTTASGCPTGFSSSTSTGPRACRSCARSSRPSWAARSIDASATAPTDRPGTTVRLDVPSTADGVPAARPAALSRAEGRRSVERGLRRRGAGGRPTAGAACGAPPRRCRPRRRSPGWWRGRTRGTAACASHSRQTALALSICSMAGPVVPTGKNRSGSVSRQAATSRQSSRSMASGIRATSGRAPRRSSTAGLTSRRLRDSVHMPPRTTTDSVCGCASDIRVRRHAAHGRQARFRARHVAGVTICRMTPVIAHRGASAAFPENTLAAFAGAGRWGPTGSSSTSAAPPTARLAVHHDAQLPDGRAIVRPGRRATCRPTSRTSPTALDAVRAAAA